MPNLTYRLLAVVGAATMATDYAWHAGARPNTEPLYALLAFGLGALVLFFAREGRRTVGRHLDVLVPIGVYQLATHALALAPVQAASFNLVRPLSVFEAGAAALLLMVLLLLLTVVFAVWQTLVIVQAVAADAVDLHGELRSALRRIPRGAAVLLIAWLGLFVPLTLLIVSGIAQEATQATMVVLLAWTVVWTFATAAWLPLALDPALSIGGALAQATRAGRALLPRWWRLLALWMCATGLLTFHVFTRSGFGSRHHSETWNVRMNWFGGYPGDTAWYLELCDDADVPVLGHYALPLAWLFAVIAIAVKTTVVARLDEPDRSSP